MPNLGSPPQGSLDARLARFRAQGNAVQAVPLAAELLQAGRARDALDVVRRALQGGSVAPELHLLEGRALLAMGEAVPAQASFVRAARALPQDARPYLGLGQVLLQRGDPMRALKALRKARALDPSSREIVALLEEARAAAGAPPSVPPPAARPSRPPRAVPPAPKRGGATPDLPDTTVAPSPGRSAGESSNRARSPGEAAPSFDDVTVRRPVPTGESSPPPSFGPHDDEEPTHQWNESLPSSKLPGGVFQTVSRPEAPDAGGAMPGNQNVAGGVSLPTIAEALDEAATQVANVPRVGALGAPTPPGPTEPPAPASAASPTAWSPSTPSAAAAIASPADLLAVLDARGLFLGGRSEAGWVDRHAAVTQRTRLARPLGIAWGVVLLLVGGGAFGWYQWLQARQAKAQALLDRAHTAALRGDHEGLVDAERWLREARRLHPRRTDVPAELLFVMGQRTLEEGRFDSSLMRSAWGRAKEANVVPALLAVGESLLAMTEGKREEAAKALTEVPDSPDPRVAYLAGRLEQRLGSDEAERRLNVALQAAQRFAAPALALAQQALEAGNREKAGQFVAQVLQHHPNHLRAQLWKAWLGADEADVEGGLAALTAFDEETMKKAAPVDRVLLETARARLLRRKGDLEGAREALERAVEAGITDPVWMARLAREARDVEALGLAEALASRAMAADSGNVEHRLLLAEILLQRRLGVRALRVLAPLSNEDPRVLRRSAEAALLVGSKEALQAASDAFRAFLGEAPDQQADPTLRALALRLEAHLGEPAKVLPKTRRLAREAPGEAQVLKALGEVALLAREVGIAREALDKLVGANPRDAEGWYLLGRTQRMAGDLEEAEEALRKAVDLAPSYADALVAYGYLLLDRGAWEEAEKLYASLARRAGPSGGASLALLGRVGRIEALAGMGRLQDARVQLEAIAKRDADRAIVRLARARLALAEGKPSEALAALRPLTSAERPSLQALSLRARALLQAGVTNAARAVAEAIVERDPGHPEARAVLAAVELRAGAYAKAIEQAQAGLQALDRRLRPPSVRAELLLTAARALLEENPRDTGRAVQLLEQASKLQGAPVETWFFLGEALFEQDAGRAKEAYRKYLELAPDGPYARRAKRALR